MHQLSKSTKLESKTEVSAGGQMTKKLPGLLTGILQCAELCTTVGVSEGTWICSGRLLLMVYSSSLVGFSLHMSTSSRSMSPLIRRPLATRPTRVTPQSNGTLSDLRPGTHTHTHAVRTGSLSSATVYLVISEWSKKSLDVLSFSPHV